MPLIVHYSDEESTPAVLEAMEAANHLVREMANIELEVLEYRLMTADDRQRLDEPSDFQPALQDTRVAAHLVFADAWEEGVSGATVVGGPLRHGAIFVAAQRLDNTRTIAHEIMHYLGLWHLTELERTDIHDPLGDTSLFDPNNLMSARADGGVELTPQQLSMVRRHPILTATCAPTIQ